MPKKIPLIPIEICGVDFTSRPSARKAITVARGVLEMGAFRLRGVQRMSSFEAFDAFLREVGPWIAGFDFPFGLPRDFCAELGWLDAGASWGSVAEKLAAISREQLTHHCRAYCNARPAGSKFAHRAADRLAGSSPSMKWVNPPVAYMLQEGAPRLLAAGVHIPGQHAGDIARIALEAYPGFLVRAITRAPYKNDRRAKQTPALATVRQQIIAALVSGAYSLAIPLVASRSVLDEMQGDATADTLDAVLCALQAAWGWQRREQNFGLPLAMDALEGWIVTVQRPPGHG